MRKPNNIKIESYGGTKKQYRIRKNIVKCKISFEIQFDKKDTQLKYCNHYNARHAWGKDSNVEKEALREFNDKFSMGPILFKAGRHAKAG